MGIKHPAPLEALALDVSCPEDVRAEACSCDSLEIELSILEISVSLSSFI